MAKSPIRSVFEVQGRQALWVMAPARTEQGFMLLSLSQKSK